MDILRISGLKKSFGDKIVLDGLDLNVPEKSIFGFIGKNGAGKTTTMKMVLGLIKADTGEIFVRFGNGYDHFGINLHKEHLPLLLLYTKAAESQPINL